MTPSSWCATCGRALSEHHRHVRFTLPEPVLRLPDRERTGGTWMSHRTPNESVMMQVPAVGAFVRALLPVHLTEDDSVTFGVWIMIDPRGNRLRSLAEIWWDDERYTDLRLEGWLANRLPRWDLLQAPVSAEVRDVAETPYCCGSTDAAVVDVLSRTWDRDEVLMAVGNV